MTSYNFKNPFLAALKQKKEISHALSLKKTYHLVFDIKGSNLSYNPGDCAVIFPQNDPEIVENCLKYLNISASTPYFDPRSKTNYSAKDFLTYKANINKLTSKLLKKFYLSQKNSQKKQKLSALVEDEKNLKNYLSNHHLIDLLEKFSNDMLTFENIFSELLPLIPRFYSISSSLKMYPDEIHLTVSYLTYQTEDGKKRFGVASHFMTQLAQPFSTPIPLYIQPNPHFQLPKNNLPIIMIGAGTGIAPFMAFLQERKSLSAKGPNWLFLGERKKAYDFLYEIFFKKLEKEKFLKLTTAFSRDQKEKVYVQHRLLQHQDDVWDWINQQAVIYVCGDAKYMAKDVEEALKTIIMKKAALSDRQACQFLYKLREEKRYLKDVY